MNCRAYVSHAESGDLWVLALDGRSGALEPLQRIDIGGTVMPLALSPDRRFLYAARRSDPLAVAGFAIDPASGLLSPLGEAPLPHSMAYLAADRGGRFLFSASYGGSLVAVSPIGPDGVPLAAQQILPTPPHAHCILSGPDNRHVYATSLGGDCVLHWHFDPDSGQLAAAAPLALPAGTGPRHLAFHPQGGFAYLLGELDGSLAVLAIDHATGALSPLQTASSLPPDFDGAPWAADLHLTPDGRFLYSSERRSGTLAVFRVDPATGRLGPAGHAATTAQPRGFAIDPSGRFLLAAGQRSHRIAVHAIDPATGALSPCGEHAVGRDPNWVELIALP